MTAARDPYAPARRRRRGRGLRVLVGLLVVLAVLLVVADRVSAAVAERAAETKMQEQAHFSSRPTVDVHGFPFLTQVVGGRYRDLEVRGPVVDFGSAPVAGFAVHLHGVHIPLAQALHRSVTSVPVDRADGSVTLGYAELAALTGVPGLSLQRAGQGVRATAALPVPALGGTVQLAGTATVQLSGRRLHVAVGDLTVDGTAVPAALQSTLAGQLSSTITVPPLPFTLALTGVQAVDDGVRFTGSGRDIVLSRG